MQTAELAAALTLDHVGAMLHRALVRVVRPRHGSTFFASTDSSCDYLMRALYPRTEPNHTVMLDVGDGHRLYVEECGNPLGEPVVFLHGGPGGGIDPSHRRFFDAARYRVFLFDQRGSGRSTPSGSVHANTTWTLVDDIERLRTYFNVDRWHVFGGSWGSTLALCYADKHAGRVKSLILRGVFLARRDDVNWFYGGGAGRFFPHAYANFVAPLSETERNDIVSAYHTYVFSDDDVTSTSFAVRWSAFEAGCARLVPDADLVARCQHPAFAVPFARIETHYFVNDSFLPNENFILESAKKLTTIPTTIVQGRYDVICPPDAAVALAATMPCARLYIVDDAGHASGEPGITNGLLAAMDDPMHQSSPFALD